MKRPTSQHMAKVPLTYDELSLGELERAGLIDRPQNGKYIYITPTGAATALALLELHAQSNEELSDGADEDDEPNLYNLYQQFKQQGSFKAYKLRISMDLNFPGFKHPCRHDVIIPADATFAQLHSVIMRIFNWAGYHGWGFTIYTGKGKDRETYMLEYFPGAELDDLDSERPSRYKLSDMFEKDARVS